MNVWWCNQSRCWSEEFDARVVCSSTNTTQPKFREMVREARKGDITVHYRKPLGMVAVSRARADAVAYSFGDTRPICIYDEGYSFPAEYHVFRRPIPRDAVLARLFELRIADGPVVRFRDGRVQIRQAYFMPFSIAGLRIVASASDRADWPAWALDAIRAGSRA
jgi:hypothetical protein